MSASQLPARPSLEQLRKQSKELLRAAHAGDATAANRLAAAGIRRLVGKDARAAVLADAQLTIAREYGFASWEALVQQVRATTRESHKQPLIRPIELRGGRPYTLSDGQVVSTDDVFAMFVAARGGDYAGVQALIARARGLAVVEYNYTPPIHFAVREGHTDIVQLLIEQGADLGYRSYPFADALLTIAEDHEHHDVASLLRRHLSQRFALRTGAQSIIDAARSGELARLRAELARDPAAAHGTNETGDTALHHAAQSGNFAMVQALLDAGVPADPIRGDGYRPIHLALMRNWLSGAPSDAGIRIADTLLEHGARYTMFIAALVGDHDFIRDSLDRDSSAANEADTNHHRPLSAAARRNDLELTRLLLQHGADPNGAEEGAPHGHALWIAADEGNLEIARLLLQYGADPNAMVESSGTPVGQARRQPQMLELLRAHGGIVDARTPAEKLGRLIHQRDFDAVESILRDQPSLLDEQHWGGEGILSGPAHSGDHEALGLLIRLGARVPLISKWAPYYYFKHEATARFLLEHGMDPNHMNWHRFTLLHHMAAAGELAKARLLLDFGANIHALDEEYCSTPLGVAARRGQRAMVEFLLERGADPNVSAADWATPLAWAVKKGFGDVAEVLRRAGASH